MVSLLVGNDGVSSAHPLPRAMNVVTCACVARCAHDKKRNDRVGNGGAFCTPARLHAARGPACAHRHRSPLRKEGNKATTLHSLQQGWGELLFWSGSQWCSQVTRTILNTLLLASCFCWFVFSVKRKGDNRVSVKIQSERLNGSFEIDCLNVRFFLLICKDDRTYSF